jgi:hypothetical protein
MSVLSMLVLWQQAVLLHLKSLRTLCLCLPRSSIGWYWGGEVAVADRPSTLPLGHELEAEWLRAVSLSNG